MGGSSINSDATSRITAYVGVGSAYSEQGL